VIKTLKTLVQTGPQIYPGYSVGALWNKSKHYARGLAFARQTKAWFKLLHRPELAVVIQRRPRLFQKLQRPYLTRTLDTSRRLQALRQHYEFVRQQFSPAIRQEIYGTQGKVLAHLPLVEDKQYSLVLCYSHTEKEGDLMIVLADLQAGVALFTLAFSVVQWEREPREIWIGGLQGNRAASHKEAIINFTRTWHGLRPKALLLFALQTLADIWGITRMRAVSDDMHIYQHWHKRREIAASYDEWWVEAGGTRAPDGLYDLPARFVPRDITALKANKRPLYRRRYRMLGEITGHMGHAFGRAGLTLHPPELAPTAEELPGEPMAAARETSGETR